MDLGWNACIYLTPYTVLSKISGYWVSRPSEGWQVVRAVNAELVNV